MIDSTLPLIIAHYQVCYCYGISSIMTRKRIKNMKKI